MDKPISHNLSDSLKTRKKVVHPGAILREKIELAGIKKLEVADQLGIRPGHLTELLKGERNVSAATALRLEKLFGIPADEWMNLQTKYDLEIARRK